MSREIGSEFNIPIKLNDTLLEVQSIIEKPYRECTYVRSGREAIGFVLDEIDIRTKIAVLPTYICKSMLEPFRRRGFSIEYFSIDDNFNPNLNELELALYKNPDVILVIDWFGMDKNREVISLAKRHSKGITILEDCTHNIFNDVSKNEIDFTISSLRKWFALPDGAIVISHKSGFKNKVEFKDNSFFNNRKRAMLLKTEYLNNGDKNLKLQYRELLSQAEHFIDNEDTLVGISNYSLSLINQMDFNSMKIKRRENFNFLYKLIDKSKVVPIIDKMLSNEECPFCFPILVENDRDELQKWLAKKDIYCPVLWPLPEDIYLNYKASAEISDNMLAIPCDQRYSTDDMGYIARNINAFFRGK